MNQTIRRIAVSGAAAVALLGGAAATATAAAPEHEATVIAIAKTDAQDPAGITNGLTPDNGSGAAIQNPLNQQQVNVTPQQIQTQAGGGAISVTVAVGLALLIAVIVMVKRGSVRALQAVACVALGVYLAPTFVGPLVQQLGGSIGTGLGNVWAGF